MAIYWISKVTEVCSKVTEFASLAEVLICIHPQVTFSRPELLTPPPPPLFRFLLRRHHLGIGSLINEGSCRKEEIASTHA